MKINKILTKASLVATSFALTAMPVMAQDDAGTDDSIATLDTILSTFITWAGILAGIVALGYLIYAGIKYITSAGDPGKTEEAQKQIVSALIGLAIVVLSYTIARLALYLLGGGELGFGGLEPITPLVP